MSTQPALPMPSAAPGAYPRAPARGKAPASGLTLTGVVLFVTSSLVVASGYMSLRPEVFGLRVHPYLVPVGIALPLVVLARIGEFPLRVLVALVVFVAIYSFSVLQAAEVELNEVFKICSAFATIIVCALLVRRRADFVAGALGLSLAVAALAWPALQGESAWSLEVMDGANKNAYSLFALPALLLAGFIATRMPTVPVYIKSILVACTLPTIVVIFMSANRSGYLGTVLVGLMLFWDRRGRGMLLVAAIAGAVVFWMANYSDTEVFEERMELTVKGSKSDTLRLNIFATSVAIALENPIIGISPSALPWELGRRLDKTWVDPHNAFGHVGAGSGLFCLAALLAVGWMLYFWSPRGGRKITGKEDPLYVPRLLMRMLIILWVVRGMFSREILYNPSFCIAIGLTIGLCILAENARKQLPAGAPLATGRGANAS